MRALAICALVACGGAPPPPLWPLADDSFASARAALVTVSAGTKTGAGFIVDPDGLVATDLHVIQGEARILITLDGDTTEYPVAQIVGFDPARDLAVVRIETHGRLPALRIAEAAAGQRVQSLGVAGSLEGVISAVRVLSPELSVLQIPAPHPEDWRGPVLDERGAVVGVVVAFTTDAKPLVLAVPAHHLRALLDHPIALPPAEFAAKTANLPRS